MFTSKRTRVWWVLFLLFTSPLMAQTLYWRAEEYYAVRSVRLDGTDLRGELLGYAPIPVGLAINGSTGEIFWTNDTNRPFGGIQRTNLGASSIATVLTEPVERVASIVVDWSAGKMYWTDQNAERVYRANLDGTVVETLGIVGGVVARASGPLVLDLVHGKLYWSGSYSDDSAGGVFRANLDGSSVEVAIDFHGEGGAGALAIDAENDALYLVTGGPCGSSTCSYVRRVNLDGTGMVDLISQPSEQFRIEALAVDSTGGSLIWYETRSRELQRSNLDGTNIATLASGEPTVFTSALSFEPTTRKLYWWNSRTHKLHRANPDGSDLETVKSPPSNNDWQFFDLDALAGKLYWTATTDRDLNGDFDGVVRRAGIGGDAALETVANASGPPGPFLPREITLDPMEGKVYWVDLSSDTVQRADLDGSNREIVWQYPSDGFPYGLTLDPLGRRFYWMEFWSPSAPRIRRSNMDATEICDVVNGLDPSHAFPAGVSLDTFNRQVYWMEAIDLVPGDDAPPGTPESPEYRSLRERLAKWRWIDDSGAGMPSRASGNFFNYDHLRIFRAPMSGGAPELVVEVPTWIPNVYLPIGGVAIDRVAGKVYWTNPHLRELDYLGRIQRANLDGSDVEDFIETPWDLATQLRIDDYYATPAGSRHVLFNIPPGAQSVAVQVSSADSTCHTWFADAAGAVASAAVFAPGTEFGLLNVHGMEIVPERSYTVQLKSADGSATGASIRSPSTVVLGRWADMATPFGVVDFLDIAATIGCFQDSPSGPPKAVCDIHPAVPDGRVTYLDISACVAAFQGKPYPFPNPHPCP